MDIEAGRVDAMEVQTSEDLTKKNEMTIYQAMNRPARSNVNILEWWQMNKVKLPLLAS